MNKALVTNRVKDYEENKKVIDAGEFKYIPFYGFNKLQDYVPGVIPGIMYKVTSHPGVGKTQISKYLFVYQTMLFAIKHKINFKVIYFALEEPIDAFIDGLFIHILKRVYDVQIRDFSLKGVFKTSLTVQELDYIKKAEVMVANLLYNIEVIDDIYKPTELYNKCKHYAKRWGTFSADEKVYTPKDPKQIVLVVADHINLLKEEFDVEKNVYLDQRKSIALWHTDYCRQNICKIWRWAVLNVQQQSAESEKQQFTNAGDTVINKLLPTMDGLGNNKEVSRDDFVAFGLFAPIRYDIQKYKGYEIKNGTAESFGDRFRSLHLLKNRFGHPNKILPLYFDGRYNYFKELPDYNDSAKLADFYKLLKK